MGMMSASDQPNPGSDLAKALGCTCPVMDNNHGKYLPWTGGWWVTPGCRLHDTEATYDEAVGDPHGEEDG